MKQINIDKILEGLKENSAEVHWQKAYDSYANWRSMRDINITLEILQESEEKDAALQVDFFLPVQEAMKNAEALFLQICRSVEEEGLAVSKIARGSVLRDDDLGLIMVPAVITLQSGAQKAENVTAFTINGIKGTAEKISITATKTQTEYISFGETEPFETGDEKLEYSITLKGVEGDEWEKLKDFTFIPQDNSGTGYFHCEWSRYSLTVHEFILISRDRRQV